MDGWIPSTIGLPPPKRKHALPKPPTEARHHNEEGVNLVSGSVGSVRLDVKGPRNGPKELKLRFLAQQDSGECSPSFSEGAGHPEMARKVERVELTFPSFFPSLPFHLLVTQTPNSKSFVHPSESFQILLLPSLSFRK